MQVTLRIAGEAPQVKEVPEGTKLSGLLSLSNDWTYRANEVVISNPALFTLSDGLVVTATPKVKAAR